MTAWFGRIAQAFFDVIADVQVPGGGRVHNLALSKDGQHLVLNYQDRVLRALEVLGEDAGGLQCYALPELRSKLAALEQVHLLHNAILLSFPQLC